MRRRFWRELVVGVYIWRRLLPARRYTRRHRSGSRLRGRFRRLRNEYLHACTVT